MQSDSADNRTAWKLDPIDGLAGQLTVNKSQKGLVGVGAFKIVDDGVLSLASLTSSGLGSKQRQKAVIKSHFFNCAVLWQGQHHPALHVVDQSQQAAQEANILYWTMSP